MRRFVLKTALFLLPVAAYVLVVVSVDPFERFGISRVSQSVKAAQAWKSNASLWTVVHFDRQPAENILLGDSRIERLDTTEIRLVSGQRYSNLGIDAASTRDVADLFWHATQRVKLQNVVIGANLGNFNRSTSRDLFKAAESVSANPLLYFSSRDVMKTTADLLIAQFRHGTPATRGHAVSRDEYWKIALRNGEILDLLGYSFDDDALAEYSRIAAYCTTNGIHLRFVILPTHADFHQQIAAFGLDAQWKSLPSRLREIAPTTDFDSDNSFTRDSANFQDPLHMKPSASKAIVDGLFGLRGATDSLPAVRLSPGR